MGTEDFQIFLIHQGFSCIFEDVFQRRFFLQQSPKGEKRLLLLAAQ